MEGLEAPSGLHAQVIAEDRLVLVVPAGHPWTHRTRGVGARELAGTPLVTRGPGSGTRGALEAAVARAPGPDAGLSAPVAEFGTATAVREAVRAGLAPAVLSDLTVADDLASGRLVAVRTTGLDLLRELRAVWLGADTPPVGPARDLIAIASSPGRRTATPTSLIAAGASGLTLPVGAFSRHVRRGARAPARRSAR